MTDPSTAASDQAGVPAGWYPVSAGSPELRWWDGTQWTDHSHTLGTTVDPPLTAPSGTSPNTVSIWIFSLLPLAQLVALPVLVASFRQIASSTGPESASAVQAQLGSTPGLLMVQAISLLLAAVWIIIAAIDYRTLKYRGVDQPFHWAWTFLSPWVYAIGRAVIVRRRTGSGLTPLVVFILAIAVEIIVNIAVITTLVGQLAAR